MIVQEKAGHLVDRLRVFIPRNDTKNIFEHFTQSLNQDRRLIRYQQRQLTILKRI